jgi:2-iminoacetate synthase
MADEFTEDMGGQIIQDEKIEQAISMKSPSISKVREILAKGREMAGLSIEEVSALCHVSDPGLLKELFDSAKQVKDEIYGKRLVLFAPLYISNLCSNECSYCAFRAKNTGVKRRALSQEEIAQETRFLLDQGHKRVLLVAGESHADHGFEYILDSIKTVYETKQPKASIRRVNVNIAPLSSENFRRLAEAEIGTYQIFQETYHRQTYSRVHLSGKKTDYDWRITAIDRAMQAGIDDVGIGVLFGLYDWRYELMALMQHIAYLEKRFGFGPHTISVPRLEPATGSDLASHPPFPVSDIDFRKIVAILRLAVPYTGIIMSTRETREMRTETFALGVSQISAGSRTNPGGYSSQEESVDQFSLGDHRELDEVIRDITSLGYVPSFCTGCYRLGRTGQDFMDLAKPGLIKAHCEPNALSTFQEYLNDFASEETRQEGLKAIEQVLANMKPETAEISRNLLKQINDGKRDVYI